MVYYAESAIADHQLTIKLFLGAMNTELKKSSAITWFSRSDSAR